MREWIARNKWVVIVGIVLGYVLVQNRIAMPLGTSLGNYETMSARPFGVSKMASDVAMMVAPPASEPVAPSAGGNRMVVTDTSMSVVVKNVSESIAAIKRITTAAGGFIVDSYVSSPQESANGSITVRVPAKDLDNVLSQIRSVGVRVTNETVMGTDVTDQYQDLEARLAVLNQTKRKFEEILNRAAEVQDLLTVQRELISLQSQIDSVKGQQLYLERTAQLSKVTIYVSTDEYSLPYAPAEPWRPEVVFKMAVRSLVGSLRSLGTGLIWLGVYGVVWVPVVGVVWWVMRKKV